MIKAKIDKYAVLGLSDANMERLAMGRPIKFDMKEMGFREYGLGIFNGRTREQMHIDVALLGSVDSYSNEDNGSVIVKIAGQDLVLIGLDDENMKHIKSGLPLQFNLNKVDVGDIEVLIYNGRTENDMYMQLRDNISPVSTIIKGSPTSKN